MSIIKKAAVKKVRALSKEIKELKDKISDSSEKVSVFRLINEKGVLYLVECSVEEKALSPEDKIRLGDGRDEIDYHIGEYFVEKIEEVL